MFTRHLQADMGYSTFFAGRWLPEGIIIKTTVVIMNQVLRAVVRFWVRPVGPGAGIGRQAGRELPRSVSGSGR